MRRYQKLKSAIEAEYFKDLQTITLIDDDKSSQYQPVMSFADYALRVYPFFGDL